MLYLFLDRRLLGLKSDALIGGMRIDLGYSQPLIIISQTSSLDATEVLFFSS